MSLHISCKERHVLCRFFIYKHMAKKQTKREKEEDTAKALNEKAGKNFKDNMFVMPDSNEQLPDKKQTNDPSDEGPLNKPPQHTIEGDSDAKAV